MEPAEEIIMAFPSGPRLGDLLFHCGNQTDNQAQSGAGTLVKPPKIALPLHSEPRTCHIFDVVRLWSVLLDIETTKLRPCRPGNIRWCSGSAERCFIRLKISWSAYRQPCAIVNGTRESREARHGPLERNARRTLVIVGRNHRLI